jgi:hypothetical protein
MKIVDASTAEELAYAAAELDPAAVDSFELLTPRALAGSSEASTAFARTLTSYVDKVTDQIDPSGPLGQVGHRRTLLLRAVLAPTTGWVISFGFGTGIAASVAASARELTSLGEPIAAPPGLPPEVANADVFEFERRVLTSLRLQDEPLDVIGQALELTKGELGELFGVSRQAVSEWMDTGIPSGRMRDVSQILRAVGILTRKLRPGRTSLVVRRPAPALAGRTILEAMREDPYQAANAVEEAFDWSGVA